MDFMDGRIPPSSRCRPALGSTFTTPAMKLALPAIALASLLGISGFAAADTVAPEITAFSVSPTAVNISSGDATVQVTVHITDDDSGFLDGTIFLYAAGNQYASSTDFDIVQRQPGGTATDGTYIIDVIIPNYGPAGGWRFEARAIDAEYNLNDYGGTDLPFPVTGSDIITVTNSGTVDTVEPQIASISISPSTVDVTSQAQTISVTIHATDDLSGLRYAYAMLRKPGNSHSNIIKVYQPNAGPGLLDQTYTFTMIVPAGSDAGTWSLTNYVRDQVGNSIYQTPTPGSTFTVVNNTSTATGGLADACDATQYSWNTSGDANWSFQTATTHDGIDAARSGPIGDHEMSKMDLQVTGPGILSFWWRVDSEPDFDQLSVVATGSEDSDVVSGNTGWTQVFLSIDSGPQTVTWTYTKDSSTSAGADAGWVDQVYFAADNDSELPTLQYIDISPDPADTAGGQVDVTITLEISDDNNGVSGGSVDLFDPSGNNVTGASFDSSNRISGNEYSGTYQVIITIYQSDLSPVGSYEPGIWRAGVYVEEDNTFDSREYGPDFDSFPNSGDEFFTVTGGSSGELGISAINSFIPGTVDVASANQTVTIDFTLADPLGEFDRGFVFLRDSNNQFVNGFFFNSPVGPSDHYSVTLTVPRYGPPGPWSVDFNLFDQVDNPIYVSGYIQTPGDNLLNVTNTGVIDSAPPSLTSIAITPGTVNTNTATANLTLTAAVSDNLTGINYAVVDFYDPNDNRVISLQKLVNDNEIVGGSFTIMQTLPQGSLQGVWRCEVILRDLLGNERIYGTGTGTNDVPFPVPAAAEFTVGTLSGPTFAAFASFYSLTGNNALPASNPDHDWANNALEFILGLDPTQANTPDPALYQVTRVGNELRLDVKIASGLTVTPSGNVLSITKAGSSPPFQVTGQTAADLSGPWTNILPQDQGGGIYRVTLPVGPGTKGFCRLKFIDP
jgi:hypothetical protein